MDDEIKQLETLSRPELVARWRAAFGQPPPHKTSQQLMRRMLAWDLQVKAYGDIAPETERALAAALAGKPVRRMVPGTRLLREWKGAIIEVEIVEGGYLFRGAVWRSLSAIANAVTGTKWSGPRFFGLKR